MLQLFYSIILWPSHQYLKDFLCHCELIWNKIFNTFTTFWKFKVNIWFFLINTFDHPNEIIISTLYYLSDTLRRTRLMFELYYSTETKKKLKFAIMCGIASMKTDDANLREDLSCSGFLGILGRIFFQCEGFWE